MDNNESTQNYQPQTETQVAQQPEASSNLQPSSDIQNAVDPLNNNQPSKKSNPKNLIAIVVMVVVLVVVTIIMVILMNGDSGNLNQHDNDGGSQNNQGERSDVTISMLQRDTQRRDDASRFISQLNQYQANNGGRVPHLVSTGDEIEAYNSFIDEYLKSDRDTFSDPLTGEDYEVVRFVKCTNDGCVDSGADENIEAGKILVYSNAMCFDGVPTFIEGERKVTVTMVLEAGGVYCSDN